MDQNPLSKVSVIATMKEKAIIISDFTEPVQSALDRLRQIDDFEGTPSFQNSLEIAKAQIDVSVPSYA